MAKDYVNFECVHITEADSNDSNEYYALAYADIDGYTANEDEEGVVICRVWLLRQAFGPMKVKGYIVDWHHNGYRRNKVVLALIEKAKADLITYEKGLLDHILDRSYDAYKLEWMRSQGYTLKDLLDRLQQELDNGAKDISTALIRLERSPGFDGQNGIWPDKEKFYDNEWQDGDYMQKLLNDNDYDIWENRP